MTDNERKLIAEKLRKEIAEAEARPENAAFQYGWLRGAISILADAIEVGRFPRKAR